MKIIAVVRNGPLPMGPPDIPGLTKYSVHYPLGDTSEKSEAIANLSGVAMAWLDDHEKVNPASWFPSATVVGYSVKESVKIDYQRTWPDTVPSPGVRRISFLNAAAGLTRAEMATHWNEVHWPIARKHHQTLWRYVQNVVINPLTKDAPEVDAIAELHFRNESDLNERFYDSEKGQTIVANDVNNFLDRESGWRILAQETWMRS